MRKNPWTEPEIRMEALKSLERSNSDGMTVTDIIEDLESRLTFCKSDEEKLNNRNDSYFSQKVRNLVSHKERKTSLMSKGFVEYDESSGVLTITPSGRKEALSGRSTC